jgi:glycosyltransferase involved in cell wall biosynthesis
VSEPKACGDPSREELKINKRLLLAGNWVWDIYEEALARGFRGNGWDVVEFRTRTVTGILSEGSLLGRARPAWALSAVNDALLKAVQNVKPDIIFLWRCIDILPNTLKAIRKTLPNTNIVVYHNDNPYDGLFNRIKFRHYLAGLRYAHVTAVYRPKNLEHALAHGAPRSELLMPSFIRSLHRPTIGDTSHQVVYIGHYEQDGREKAIYALHEAGIDVRVYGTGWEAIQKKTPWLASQPIQRVWGEDYVRVLSGSRISLAFLSSQNQDVYTRRCFEIPACGSVLVAPRTKELAQIFHDDEEAVLWGSTGELVEKVRYLLANEAIRRKIASAGHRRVVQDRHDEYGRAQQIIEWFES